MRKLRVLTLANYFYPGGVTNRIIGLINGLDRERIDHTVAMIFAPDKEIEARYGTMLPYLASQGVEVLSLGERRSQAPSARRPHVRLVQSALTLVRGAAAIERVVREREIDVIDSQCPPAHIVATLAGRRTKKPVVVTLYWVGAPAPIVLWPIAGRVALDSAKAVVTDSHARARDIQTWMYRRREKVEVIPNGVPLRKSEFSREEARERFGIPPGACVVAQVGALAPFKGPMVLLEAARDVLRKAPHAFFLIVGHVRGEAGFDDALRRRADELGIAERVRIGEYEGPIADVWQAADIQSHASLFDSLPAAIIEGMSAGVPTVGTTTGGIPEIVRDGETGSIVPANDAPALARALLRLIDDQSLREQLGKAAFRRYEECYTPAVTARAVEDLFYRCAGWQ